VLVGLWNFPLYFILKHIHLIKQHMIFALMSYLNQMWLNHKSKWLQDFKCLPKSHVLVGLLNFFLYFIPKHINLIKQHMIFALMSYLNQMWLNHKSKWLQDFKCLPKSHVLVGLLNFFLYFIPKHINLIKQYMISVKTTFLNQMWVNHKSKWLQDFKCLPKSHVLVGLLNFFLYFILKHIHLIKHQMIFAVSTYFNQTWINLK
jgi:hypothetical protein